MTLPKIIVVNRFYWPDESATSQILDGLARHLAAGGAAVHVVTSCGRRGAALPKRAVRDGVAVHRVRTSHCGARSLAGRLLDYLTFYLGASWRLFRIARRGDQFLVKTDPPLMSVPAAAVARLRGARLVLWHQDLFPEAAVAVGVLRPGGWLARVAYRVRKPSLLRAERHVAICDGMVEKLAGQGVARSRISLIPNWSDAGLAPVAAAQNPLRCEWGLGDAFVIGYSGNLGRVHQADRVVELVRRTCTIPGLVWLFVGGGVGMRRIEALQREIGPEAVRLHPHQPRGALSQSLSVPDLHLVSLEPRCEGLIMPSKLYGIMAVGRPVLNLGAADGAVARELAANGIGWTLGADPEDWRASVERLVRDRAAVADIGRRARAIYQQSYRPEKSLAAWQLLLEASSPQERSGVGATLRAPLDRAG